MPGNNQSTKHYHYDDEFKVQAVEMSLTDGFQVKQVADSLGVHPVLLSRWRKEYREGKFETGKRQVKRLVDASQKPGKIASLEREVVRLRQENEILKKWQRFLAEQKANGSSS